MDKITMEDIMQWLEAQRTEVIFRLTALGDGDESHVEYSSDAKTVRIINAIVKRVQEMTAVEYLEAKIAMCDSVWNDANEDYGCCSGCELHDPETELHCQYIEYNSHRRAVEIVKKWKEEHNSD